MKYQLTSARTAIITKSTNNNGWRGCGEKEILLHCGRNKLINPLWGAEWRFPCCCSLSRVQLFATPWTEEFQASLSFTITWSLLKLMSIDLVMPSNHLIFYHPLLLLPSIFPRIWVFSNESVRHIRWPKYWSFSISASSEYSGHISLGLTGFISL